jgi:hypothetical protein
MIMGGWSAIQYVGGGVSLVAFLAAAALYAYTAWLRHQAQTIKSAPEKDRVEAIATAAEFFRVDLSKWPVKQQQQVVLTQIEMRARRDMLRALVVAVFAILLAVIALVAILYSEESKSKRTLTSPTETWSVEVGGSGGSLFGPLACQPDEAMVGLFGKAFAQDFRVFSIGPICAKVRIVPGSHSQQLSIGAPRKGDEAGASNGNPFELNCPANMVVTGSELQSVGFDNGSTYLIDHLTLKCSKEIQNAASVEAVVKPEAAPISFATRQPFSCPEGTIAIGIRGRAGQWIDALSIGCRDPQVVERGLQN